MKSNYVPWYRLAQDVLGDLLPSLSDKEIMNRVSRRNYLIFPLEGETTKDEAANRPDPHIDIKLGEGTIRIGLRCNTIESVEKMQNILDSFHSKEKDELLNELKKLDDDFQTAIYVKIKEMNFAQAAEYNNELSRRSNEITDEKTIDQIFEKVRQIREEGLRRMHLEGKSHNPETPVIDLATVTIPQDSKLFREKINELKRLYEICLRVKTTSQLGAEKKRLERERPKISVTKFKCSDPKCGREYSEAEFRASRFCRACKMRIIALTTSE